MSHLDPERLALLAIGEQGSPLEEQHLDSCDVCALELAELEHTVAIGRSTVTLGPLETPPERVWEGIADELQLGRQATGEGSAGDGSAAPETPPRADAAPTAPVGPASRRGRGARLLFALAASAAVIFVLAGAWAVFRPAPIVEVASATLAAFPDHPGAEGTATVVETSDGEREVRVELEGGEADDGYREVWLITEDASALVSLGVLEGATGTFPVPDGIDLHDYVLVDISLEPADGDPAHSGDSIVRGALDFA